MGKRYSWFALTAQLICGCGGLLRVQNSSSIPVCYVHIASVHDPSWGSDRLGATEVIPPGYGRTFRVATGRRDLLLQACGGEKLAVHRFTASRTRVVYVFRHPGQFGQVRNRATPTVQRRTGRSRSNADVSRALGRGVEEMLRQRNCIQFPQTCAPTNPGTRIRCNDGTISPNCRCGGPLQGCCSWHGGVAGCAP